MYLFIHYSNGVNVIPVLQNSLVCWNTELMYCYTAQGVQLLQLLQLPKNQFSYVSDCCNLCFIAVRDALVETDHWTW